MLEATCDATGNVTAGALLVTEAEVLSEGTKASAGVLLLDEDKAFYLTSSASDVKKLITDLVAILDKIVTIATGIDAASNSPGGQTANIALLTTLKTQLNTSKDTLK